MEQEFQTHLMKHAGALMKLMNKLQDMVHCSQDLREVIEKAATPDILYCDKVKKTTSEEKNVGSFTIHDVKPQTTGTTFEQPPVPAKKLKKSIKLKKPVKFNTDCNIDESTIIPQNF